MSASGAEVPGFKFHPKLWGNGFLLLGFQTVLFPNPKSITIDADKVPSKVFQVSFKLTSAYCVLFSVPIKIHYVTLIPE